MVARAPRHPARSKRTDRSRIGACGFWCKWAQTKIRQYSMSKQVLCVVSYKVTGLTGNETIKDSAIETP